MAGGLSNRAIARELVITEATAERHLGNVFAKLGLASRAQLAVWALEHGLGPRAPPRPAGARVARRPRRAAETWPTGKAGPTGNPVAPGAPGPPELWGASAGFPGWRTAIGRLDWTPPPSQGAPG